MTMSTEGYSEGTPKPPDDLFPSGEKIDGYVIERLIGVGGMGEVYLATQQSLGRKVAVKVLSVRFSRDEAFVRRFHREASALAGMSHPNIVSVIDKGAHNGRYYFVMEYVDGVNLRQILQQKKLTPEEAIRIVPQLCDALEYAHGRGIFHRDIKPENILFSKSGLPKIADFGLSKIAAGEGEPEPSITQSGTVMGTREYMAPEVRLSVKQGDHRADIFSMGVVFYEMLTGELPIGRFPPPSRKVQLDVRLDDVVLKTLESDPNLRYQRASEVGKDVSSIAVSRREEASGEREKKTGMTKNASGKKSDRIWSLLSVLFFLIGYMLMPVFVRNLRNGEDILAGLVIAFLFWVPAIYWLVTTGKRKL